VHPVQSNKHHSGLVLSSRRAKRGEIRARKSEEQGFARDQPGNLRAELHRLASGTQKDTFAVSDSNDSQDIDRCGLSQCVGIARSEMDDRSICAFMTWLTRGYP